MIQRQVASLLLLTVLGLIAVGLIMLTSTGAKYASSEGGEMYSYLNRQALWILPSALLCIFLSWVDYHDVVALAPWILGVAIFFLLLVFVPGLGRDVKGAYRWITLGGMNFQPSELAKMALVLWLAYWISRPHHQATTLVQGFLIPAAVVGGMATITIGQKDLGVTAMIIALFLVVMFCGGARKRYLFPLLPTGIVGILLIAYLWPERRGRLLAFLDPEKYAQQDGYQPLQALIALGSGGAEGFGLGNSRQKLYYLPEAHTDFIFPILGEELGLWVALSIVGLYLIITLCGGWITLHAPDMAGVLLGIGLTAMVSIQAMINLAVVTSMVPTKGMPLPFISYGGSNLLLCLAVVGLLFNLSRQGIDIETKKKKRTPLPAHLSPRM